MTRTSQGLMIAAAALCFCSWASAADELKGRVVEVDKVAPLADRAQNGLYHVARAKTRPAMDGKLDEWKDVAAIVLDKKEQSRGPWTGPADLSGSMRMLWDDEALYLCLHVTDNVHAAPNADKLWWENDSCQFAFDPHLNGPAGGYDPDEETYVVCNTPKGPILGAYRLPGPTYERETLLRDTPVKMSVLPDGTRAYQWTMSWRQLTPISPWILGRCGFSFSLNDNDGKGFKGALFWTKGVIYSQDASKFGQIVFDGAAGTRPAAIGLRPEFKSPGSTGSYWLQIPGADPWDTARLLVVSPQEITVEAQAEIYRERETTPIATGTLKHRLQANRPTAFLWDTGSLPNGKYELVYKSSQIAGLPEYRLGFFRLNIDRLLAMKKDLREQFGIDRPWDRMDSASPLIRRHRGMAALALELLDKEVDTSNSGTWTESMNNVDKREETLKALASCAAMVEAVGRGEDYLARLRGVFLAAYYSPADASGQVFVVALPPDYDPARTYPLVVTLHGAGGVPMPKDSAIQNDMKHIAVMPWGRGKRSSYRGLGEIDILSVISHMKQWYKIDEDRVCLTGASMGGGGTWRIACRHPDLFSAGAPLCGWGTGMPLENLRHVPFFNQHGGQDWSVAIDGSRYAVSVLQRLDYFVLHKEIPEASHNITQVTPYHDWLLSLRRPAKPIRVTFTTGRPDAPFNSAYWLAVRKLADPRLPATVNAAVEPQANPQSLMIGLANVHSLTLDTDAMPLDRNKDLHVQIGFDFLEQKAPLPKSMLVSRLGDRWTLAAATPEPAQARVRPYCAGAAANLFTGEPLMIVYGSNAPKERVQLLQDCAAKISKCTGAPWDRTPLGGFTVKADRDVTQADMQRFNLVLIGGVKENQITAALLPQLPLKINDKHELIAGDREPVSLTGAGLKLFCRNPLQDSGRLLFIIACDEDSKEARAWYGQGPWLLTAVAENTPGSAPDLTVQTLAAPGGQQESGPDRRRMQFTHDWQWRSVAGADRRVVEGGAEFRRLVAASLAVIRRTAGADFAVEDCPKKGEKWCDPDWFTQADAAIDIVPNQILIGGVTGEELLEIYEKWVTKEEIVFVPSFDPKTLDAKRIYRLAMDPRLAGKLKDRQKNLRDVEAGPDWNPQELWNEGGLFK